MEELTNTRLNKHSEEIDRLTICIEKLETIVKLQNEQLERIQQDHETRLRSLENKPAESWEKSVWAVVGAMIAGVVAFMLMQLGLK